MQLPGFVQCAHHRVCKLGCMHSLGAASFLFSFSVRLKDYFEQQFTSAFQSLETTEHRGNREHRVDFAARSTRLLISCFVGFLVFTSVLFVFLFVYVLQCEMPQEVARELAATAKALTAPGKGLLAADESTGKYGHRLFSCVIENLSIYFFL